MAMTLTTTRGRAPQKCLSTAAQCISSGGARPSASFSRANRGCLEVFGAAGNAVAKVEIRDVRIRNSDAQRHPNLQLNLVIQKKVARIQAAGVNGFVKGSTEIMGDA